MNKLLPSIFIWIIAYLLPSCNEEKEDQTSALLPAVETSEVTYIEVRSALSGGNITDSRGEAILARGVCWSTSQNPTIADNYVIDETETVSFLSTLSDLLPGTTYYVRAYATNTHGTGYGQQRIFTTLQDNQNGNGGSNEEGIIYFWQEGNMPSTTNYTSNPNNQYADDPDFRPHMIKVPANPDVPIKGAILICAGGAFQFRSNAIEGFPVAQALSELGYQCFVVNYRLRPYTQQEGALDLARGVRYVRSRAENYGISENNIAVMGFSAGGILCGELLLNYKGLVNGTSLDSRYTPDALDQVSADASAIGHIYSFYGRLSVASTNVQQFRNANLPPAFFCYGTQDPFVNQFAACVNALRQAEVPVETHILQDWPHGYGYRGDWIPVFDNWLTTVFTN